MRTTPVNSETSVHSSIVEGAPSGIPSAFCTCDDCDENIPKKRIAAVFANTGKLPKRCAPCQSRVDLSPLEQFGADRLASVGVVRAERDGEQFRVGGDCSGY